MDLQTLFAAKKAWEQFTKNHPKVPEFLDSVKDRGIEVGQEIAIAVKYTDGTIVKTGIRVSENDMDLIKLVNNMK